MKYKIAINAGSSSRKIKVFDESLVEVIKINMTNHQENEFLVRINDEEQSIAEHEYKNISEFLFRILGDKNINASDIDFISHRVVHGGEEFKKPTKIDKLTLERIRNYNTFAPLHNPFALEIIENIFEKYPDITQYAVFDTSFHLTNPRENYLYGLPYGYYENIGVRRFGFHGISYQSVLKSLSDYVDLHPTKINAIVCHLGSGSSVCLIEKGKSIDHSFGFSPDENLVMATRSGEVDYDAVKFVKDKLMLTDKDIERLLNYESGLLGISGYTKDMKTLLDDYESNERARLAVDMYVKKIVEFVSKLYVASDGTDYLIFTGGVGAGSDIIRKKVTESLGVVNIRLDDSKNDGKQNVSEILGISAKDSGVKVMVVPTDEEREMISSL